MAKRRALTKKIRSAVLTAAGGLCEIKGSQCTKKATEVDHIRPVAQGGTNDRENLRASCMICNRNREKGLNPLMKDVSYFNE